MGGRFIIYFVYLFSAEIGYLKYDRFASSLTVLSSSALSDARILIQSDIHAVGTLHSLGSTLEKEKEARKRSKLVHRRLWNIV